MNTPAPLGLLFGGDFHISDYPQYGSLERGDDFLRAFICFVEAIVASPNTRGGVLLGDITDLAHPSNAILKHITLGFARIRAAGKVIYYMGGNHDNQRPTLGDCLNALCPDSIFDAEQAYLAACAAGKPFKPYGPGGPSVVAVNNCTIDELPAILARIRETEPPGCNSSEIWLHQAIGPAIPTFMIPEIDGEQILCRNWHTIIAGDIHNPSVTELTSAVGKGILIYPGSPEMTSFNEDPDKKRGFILHHPDGPELAYNRKAFQQIPYQHRPFSDFVFATAQHTAQEIEEIKQWAAATALATGLKPIVRVCSPDPTWRDETGLSEHVFLLKTKSTAPAGLGLVPTAPELLTPDGQVVSGNPGQYGSFHNRTSLFKKLAIVLGNTPTVPDDAKPLLQQILAHPNTPDLWDPLAQQPEPHSAAPRGPRLREKGRCARLLRRPHHEVERPHCGRVHRVPHSASHGRHRGCPSDELGPKHPTSATWCMDS